MNHTLLKYHVSLTTHLCVCVSTCVCVCVCVHACMFFYLFPSNKPMNLSQKSIIHNYLFLDFWRRWWQNVVCYSSELSHILIRINNNQTVVPSFSTVSLCLHSLITMSSTLDVEPFFFVSWRLLLPRARPKEPWTSKILKY